MMADAPETPHCSFHSRTDWMCQACRDLVNEMIISPTGKAAAAICSDKLLMRARKIVTAADSQAIGDQAQKMAQLALPLAEYVLATRSSDGGEAISEEWLREIGGKWTGPRSGGGQFIFTNENGASINIGRDSFGWIVRLGVDGDGGQWPEHLTTRPQLLHLLAALGCGVQQTTKGTKNVD